MSCWLAIEIFQPQDHSTKELRILIRHEMHQAFAGVKRGGLQIGLFALKGALLHK